LGNQNQRNDFTTASESVDRFRRSRRFRLVCGLHIEPNFETILGSLMISKGTGKWLRMHRQQTVVTELPKHLTQACVAMCEAGDESLTNWVATRTDLAVLLAQTIEPLLGIAGRMSEQVLAACIVDPSLWTRDFDGQYGYTSFSDAALVAEQAGLCIIDELPARDIQAGGVGVHIEPLAHWFLFADRREPEATESRMLVQLDSMTKLTFLPASDGLDSEFPEITLTLAPGMKLIDRLAAQVSDLATTQDASGKLAVQGGVLPELLEAWQQMLDSTPIERSVKDPEFEQLDWVVQQRAAQESWSYQDMLRSACRLIADQVVKQVRSKQSGNPPLKTVILSGVGAENGLIVSEIRQQLEDMDVVICDEFGIGPKELPAVTAAILGLMHIDQMPVNLPHVTGADVPRILGRLTPGRPGNWRQLLLEMADYRPPAMKLREAI